MLTFSTHIFTFKKKQVIVFTCFFFLLMACRKDRDVSDFDFGHAYYPVEVGNWYLYQVDSIAFFEGDTTKHVSYQLLEYYESIIEDNQGRDAFRFERYRKYSESDNWNVSEVWQSILLSERVERTEENQRIIKLVFPVRRNQTWDGNAYNTFPEQTYFYANDSLFIPKMIQGSTYDSTITVIQLELNPDNVIRREFEDEVYAKNIGLIERREVHLDTEVTGEIKSGYMYTKQLLDFGHEDDGDPFEM